MAAPYDAGRCPADAYRPDVTSPSSGAPVAYLVLAHHRPEQAIRLCRRILAASSGALVFLHWGASSPFPAAELPPGAELVRARPAAWGRWSLVDATLALLRRARAMNPRWMVLISGVDWPARDLAAWEAELDRSGADALLWSRPIDDHWVDGPGVSIDGDEVKRYRDRWLILPPIRSRRLRRMIDGVVRRLERPSSRWGRGPGVLRFYGRGYAVTLGLRRLRRTELEVHKGEQWLTLGHRAVDAVLAAPPRLTRHFRRTLIPDEAYLHTIVRADPRLTVLEGHTSFAPWHAFARAGHLRLEIEDIEEVRRSGAPFARKLDHDDPSEVIAALDALDPGPSSPPSW